MQNSKHKCKHCGREYDDRLKKLRHEDHCDAKIEECTYFKFCGFKSTDFIDRHDFSMHQGICTSRWGRNMVERGIWTENKDSRDEDRFANSELRTMVERYGFWPTNCTKCGAVYRCTQNGYYNVYHCPSCLGVADRVKDDMHKPKPEDWPKFHGHIGHEKGQSMMAHE